MKYNIELPENVCLILSKLEEYGGIGYVVGGCVRDSLLGKVPKDWDICTPLLPEVIETVFNDFRVIETGIKHGTVTVCIDDEQYEITTYRVDGEYSDGRRPDNVDFTDRLEEDLKRRDFTINAMAYNPKVGLIDNNNGIYDLKNGIIRCVGLPEQRFHEDGLRVLRAMRFAAVLGFDIEWKTFEMMSRCKNLLNLDSISIERKTSEISKMLSESNSHSLYRVLKDNFDVFYTVFPCLYNGDYEDDESITYIEEQTMDIIRNTPNSLHIRLAALLDDIERNELDSAKKAEEFLHNIKFDNHTIKDVVQLIKFHEMYHELTGDYEKDAFLMRKLLNAIGAEQVFRLVELWKANVKAKSNIGKYDKLRNIDFAIYIAKNIINEHQCYTLKDLDISGDDLIKIGFEPGEKIGEVLNKLLDVVMKEPFKNKKNWLIAWAEKELNNATEE